MMNTQNFLVFRIGHLGDTVVALPAFWHIKKSFPNAKLTLLSNKDLKNTHYFSPQNVLPVNGIFDDWLTYPTNLSKLAEFAAFFSLSREIRRRKFDSVIYLMPQGRSIRQIDRDALFFRFCSIRKIFGAETAKEYSFGVEKNGVKKTVLPEIDFLFKCLTQENLLPSPNALETDLLLDSSEIQSADAWFNSIYNSNDRRKIVAVAPSGKRHSRMWPEERFADVILKLIKSHNIFPIIFCGPEDEPQAERLLKIWGTGASMAGLLSVREAAVVLKKCAVYVGNDTGTMHIAAAVKVPCVGIFSAADHYGQWFPFGDNNIVLRERVECEGCQLDICPYNNRCLDMIHTDEVYRACSTLLGGRG